MSNYSNCRDSYVQYQHLAKSHNVLYHEWMDDGALPTPDQILRNLPHRSRGSDNGAIDQDDTMITNDIESTVGFTVSDKYWDFFCDDEQWEIFHTANLTVEPNGNLMFNRMISAQGPLNTVSGSVGRNIYRADDDNHNNSNDNGNNNNSTTNDDGADTDHHGDNNHDNDNQDKDIVVGSAFDRRTLQQIKQKVNGWTNGFPNFT
ncbi:similar to Saccharomyces cerevisiae YDR260C SWM1 Subunit of the anaphase-promoting complex [Maudiozyma saulgeensis]|uniref:Similar to Saccharomyces cerevisiae YDR260C SWM1 Subunit of the anaphase-promoting complex n=1 Tax=Maudiozyma saulgeensis TaxID=1789683 RepID=A0A1X7RBD5_9SACH|nr:similar to Saccharomyces cerevisiae YDR260C SWM1 Subunit of the anaphase-promoting complex [Kazachstania saulgeensis]